ncbi:MAG: hypothetical protein H6916_13190 [Novosphingobium sp.]|uniref:hypothetical protein n=1 Tax=Novosphingobium sp. TaxID=1874826 RepID=UPI001D8C4488|nr:hypothetical protein [Novosphingobium sp.]MCB2057419.1 hypothetical protein [Novosphingobium sp.]MCP5387749.1 hypothetical protein [Novosphingobium sp.]
MRFSHRGVPQARRFRLAVAGASFSAFASATGYALPLSDFKDQGVDHIFGSYAPGGDCSKEPRVVIDQNGMLFRAKGREVRPQRVEYALTFLGASYDGMTAVFFPFPVSNDDYGRVIMFVNDDEKPGVIRFDADLPPGGRPDPFHAAFTNGGPFILCKGSAPAGAPPPPRPEVAVAVPGIPAEWNNLAGLVGKYPGEYSKDNIDIFDKGAVAAALKTLLGPKMAAFQTNLSAVSPLQRAGRYFYLTGNAPHQGGVEQAYLMIDPARREVQVGLWQRGKLTVYPPASGIRLPVAPEIKKMLDDSPPETAVALPGTPWEVVPVPGRAPIAYVSAAASPNIEALSLYCEGGKPFMAMLLNKPAPVATMTMTWNFSGRLVNIPVQRANSGGTQWIGGLSGTELVPLLIQQSGTVMLRINGRLEGEASLDNSAAVLRSTLRGCAKP